MVWLLTPTRGVSGKDIDIRERLLEESIGNVFLVGFEIILLGGADGDIESPDQIEKNLERFSRDPDFYICLHSPFEFEDFTRTNTDLTTNRGKETLEKTLRLATRINARLVNLHAQNFHFGEDLLKRDLAIHDKRGLQARVVGNILEARNATGYSGSTVIENMSYPLMGDDERFGSIESMPYDPLVNSIDDIQFFAGTKELGVCIDTCHYGITQKAFNDVFCKGMSADDRRNRGILGVTEYDLKPQPGLSELPQLLGDSLKYVHLSDFRGTWIHGKSFFEEGLVPGEGEYGEEIALFLKAIANRDIAINVEIKDKDFNKLEDSRRAIKAILKTLQE